MDQALLLFPTESGRRWLRFRQPVRTLVANQLSEVDQVITQAEQAQADGFWVVLALSYDSAPAFDAALVSHRHPEVPLVSVGIFEEPAQVDGPITGDHAVGEWAPTQTEHQHAAAVAAVRSHLEAGNSYQVNLSTRMRTSFEGSPEGLFARIARAQGAAHSAFVDLGDHAICSASPELLFRRQDNRLVCRPMKGTAARQADVDADLAAAAALPLSAKERAENTMIVDMVRNDMGRVSRTGSVQVPHLHRVEHYPTVHQMTSVVESECSAPLLELLRALFPGASITGAPKVRTSQIIAELEPEARGIYCGSIGVLAPSGLQEFNLTIRTVWINKVDQIAEYGVGGGIVWDSHAQGEWSEVLTKAAVLTTAEPPFSLLETMLWEPGTGIAGLAEHMKRLERSARHFSFALNVEDIRNQLEATCSRQSNADKPRRVRLLLDVRGVAQIQLAEVPPASDEPWVVPVDTEPVRADDVFLQHKTTERLVYNAARVRHLNAPDVILWNEHGQLTETTIGNLVLELDGRLLTPKLACGLLAGTARTRALAEGTVAEAVLMVEDLQRATGVWMINAVRGWTPLAVLAAG